MAGAIALPNVKQKEVSMWRVLLVLLFAGCAQLPPSPQDIQSKKFESVADKAVIYIVRTQMDSNEAGTLQLDDIASVTTYPGTYYRWEVAPGPHRIAGFAGESGLVKLDAQPGKIYFVRHTVLGTRRAGWQYTNVQKIGEEDGRKLVMQSRLL
ncbi:MAG TPA: hypothetical protein VLT92_18330 [Burkholderiales bacterium]|nr:hypothetical protein [Burkholderiales bacterium]